MGADQTKPFIRLTGIEKSFGGVHALKGVDLTLFPGEVHALAGENGSGKSTLIKILSGVYKADRGTIEINGKRYRRLTAIDAVREGIQIIYQDLSVFPNLTVRENIAVSSEIMTGRRFSNKKRTAAIARAAMERLGFDIDPETRVDLLNVADKQLVALARALHQKAKLIVMDEPTTALTHHEVTRLFSIVEGLKRDGVTILFVSHKIDEVFSISENYTVLRSGERVAHGRVEDLTSDDFTYYMTGRRFSDQKPRREVQGEAALEVEQLSKRNCFEDVSFTLRRGEILAITGSLGSGRTELAEAIFGLAPPDRGRILINGEEAAIKSVRDAMRHGIGYVPGDRLTEGLFLRRSIMDNAIITNIDAHAKQLGVIDQPSARSEARTWLEQMRLNTEDLALPVSALSGGNQQKVILARWLATEPRIFILNSPTVGVDIGAKYDLYQILRQCAERGMAIIVISDDIPEVMACSDRILVMRDGKVIRELISDEVTEQDVNAVLDA